MRSMLVVCHVLLLCWFRCGKGHSLQRRERVENVVDRAMQQAISTNHIHSADRHSIIRKTRSSTEAAGLQDRREKTNEEESYKLLERSHSRLARVGSHIRLFSHSKDRLLFAGLLYVCAVILYVSVLSWIQNGKVRRFQVVKMSHKLMLNACQTVIVPTSYDLMVSLGGSATLSGLLIGISCAGEMTTIHMGLIVARLVPADLPKIQVWGYSLLFVSMLTFGIAANPAMVGLTLSSTTQIAVLMGARFAQGVSEGYAGFAGDITVWKVTPKSDMIQLQICTAAAATLGFGLGPLLCSASYWIAGNEHTTIQEQASRPLFIVALLYFPVLVSACCNVPIGLDELIQAKQERDVFNETRVESNVVQVERLPPAIRSQMWIAARLFGVERAFAVSSVEGGTSLILEKEFHWQPKSIGLAIGTAFACGFPFAIAVRAAQKRFCIPDLRMLIATTMMAMTATMLFFPGCGKVFGHADYVVLLADTLILPAFCFASGIVDGIGIRCCMPDTMFTLANWKLSRTLSQNAFARFLAPAIARTVIDTWGRKPYAISQLSIGLCACLSSVFMVHLHGK